MKHRKLGLQGPQVSALGLGCMSIGIAETYTSSLQSDAQAVALIHRALDLGITLLDTADIYGESERLVGEALKGRRDRVIVATKFGFTTGVSANERRDAPGRMINGSARYVHQACDASLQRLGFDYIDLYYLHRVDPGTPIEETVGAMADLVKQGKVRSIGLSEPSAATVRRAQKVHPLAAIQTEYSLFSRDPEDELLRLLYAESAAGRPSARACTTQRMQRGAARPGMALGQARQCDPDPRYQQREAVGGERRGRRH